MSESKLKLKAREPVAQPPDRAAPAVAPVYVAPQEKPNRFNPFEFDRPLVNAIAPPLVVVVAVFFARSPLSFLMEGFHVWVHEFGHATVAWFTGKRALPLPIGWTNVGAEKSKFVYFGVLLLLGILFGAGAREKKVWPMVLAVCLAALQYTMTWRMPEERAYLWQIFGGVGGELYLSAAMMGAFYFQFPEKFKWGLCRYPFLFIGAGSFSMAFTLWYRIQRGQALIPFGSMVNGEEDAGGDMNILSEDFHWGDRRIIATYNHLGQACVLALLMIYGIYALGLNRLPARLLGKTSAGSGEP